MSATRGPSSGTPKSRRPLFRAPARARQLVPLYFERSSPKAEPAVMRWLERDLTEASPTLQHFAEITASLARRETN